MQNLLQYLYSCLIQPISPHAAIYCPFLNINIFDCSLKAEIFKKKIASDLRAVILD